MKNLETFNNSVMTLPRQFMQRITGGETYRVQVEETCTGSGCDTLTTTSTDAGRVTESCVKTDSERSC